MNKQEKNHQSDHDPHSDHQNHEGSFLEFVEHEEHVFIRILKKLGIAAAGLLMILLIVSLSIPLDTVNSLVQSSKSMDEGDSVIINLDETHSIIFTKEIFKQLQSAYLAEQQKEIKVCLTGTKNEDDYLVTGMYMPAVHSHSFNQVRAQLCDEDTIIDLHSHPYRSCIFSDVDISSLDIIRTINPDMILALMCDVDRFNVYGHNV